MVWRWYTQFRLRGYDRIRDKLESVRERERQNNRQKVAKGVREAVNTQNMCEYNCQAKVVSNS